MPLRSSKIIIYWANNGSSNTYKFVPYKVKITTKSYPKTM
jgi:hypothetical protein